MGKMAFELLDRRRVEDGLTLIFKCVSCGDQVSLVIRDRDPLRERYPVSCLCGAEVNMFFGSPRVARSLLKALKNDPSPLLN